MDKLNIIKNLNNVCDFIEKDENIYKLQIDNKKYIFKPVSKDLGISLYELYFNELFISRLAKYLNIDCVDVEMAVYSPTNSRFNKEYGILISDYNLKNYVAYFGSYFLEQYYERLKEKNKLDIPGLEYDSKNDALEKMNNLRTIYVALTYFFSDYVNRDLIVENIMKDLSKVVCLDYLTMQDDRTIYNWGILLSIKKEPKLMKIYNNKMAFNEDYIPKLKTLNSYETKEETLINFLKLSDSYKNEFLNIYKSLTPEKVCEIINQMELENDNCLKTYKKYKEKIIKKYSKNYHYINEILNKVESESRDNYAR